MRGRDLDISIVTDLSGFDTRRPAAELDQLADAGDKADTALAGLDTRRPAAELDQLADAAHTTAARVDDALDTIRTSARGMGEGVDDAADKTRTSMRDLGAEVGDTAREAAASFTGSFDDVGDAVQESVANALAKLGPAGAAAGIAAAAGIGVVIGQLQAAADEANATAERVVELADALHTAGGALDGQALADQLRDWGKQIVDQKSWWELWQRDALTQMDKVRESAGLVGVDVREMFAAMSGADAAATQRALAAINTEIAREGVLYTEAGPILTQRAEALAAIRDQMTTNASVWDRAHQLETDLAAVTGTYTAAVTASADALRDAATESAAYYSGTGDIDRWAKKVGESHDLATLSVKDYLRQLEDEVAAQAAWANNMTALTRRGVDQGVLQELARLGPEGAPMVAKLVNASDTELSRLEAAMNTRARQGAAGIVAGLAAGTPDVIAQGKYIREQIDRALTGQPISIPVTAHLDTSFQTLVSRARKMAEIDVKFNP